MTPRVSVVLPVYNGERFVKRAIDSVLAQTVLPYELIVIDDGSRDGTSQILASYGDRIKAHAVPNGGVARAMSLGLSLATGDWVAFIDHDDWWFRRKLERHAELAARYPDAGFFCSNFATRPVGLGRRLVAHFSRIEIGHRIGKTGPYLADAIPAMLHENIVGTSTAAMIRMDVAKRVGFFNPAYRISGDYDYWLRCAGETPFIVCPEMLFYKKTHDSNISADEIRTFEEHRQALRDFLQKNEPLLLQRNQKGLAARESAAVEYRMGNIYFNHGRPAEAFKAYRRALAADARPANAAVFAAVCAKKGIRWVAGRCPKKRQDVR